MRLLLMSYPDECGLVTPLRYLNVPGGIPEQVVPFDQKGCWLPYAGSEKRRGGRRMSPIGS